MFGQCGHKLDAEIAPEYARVYCDQADREAKLGDRATLMTAQRRLCNHCQGLDTSARDDVKRRQPKGMDGY